jgi:hypothetical protein
MVMLSSFPSRSYLAPETTHIERPVIRQLPNPAVGDISIKDRLI